MSDRRVFVVKREYTTRVGVRPTEKRSGKPQVPPRRFFSSGEDFQLRLIFEANTDVGRAASLSHNCSIHGDRSEDSERGNCLSFRTEKTILPVQQNSFIV